MLSLPIYLRNSSYYLHTRVAGKQFKRSLQTPNKKTAIIRAVRILELILSKSAKPEDFNLDNIKRYEIDISRGIYRADGLEDHQMMMEALKGIQAINATNMGSSLVSEEKPKRSRSGLTMIEVLEKFFLLKSGLKPATRESYEKTVKEFSLYLKNPPITEVSNFDITKYQEFLANNSNTTRTIDNKVSVLGTMFNFAIKQGYLLTENPAKARKLQSNREREKDGYAIFDTDEIKLIYQSEFLANAKEKDPDYYWCLILGLLTGCRISEITSLTRQQFKVSESGVNWIQIYDSKTQAGVRFIPISDRLMSSGLMNFIRNKEEKIFKYNLRLGKGSGNAVGKKFNRHLDELKISRPKLVFHSLRKFCNNFMGEDGVPYNALCQFIGHEIEGTNNTIYRKKFSLEGLEEVTRSSILKLEILAGIVQTKF